MLRDRAFRMLFLGQVLTGFASNALFLSLGVWAKDLTGSNAAAGLVFFCVTLPVLGGPLAGYAVDRFRRRSVLLGVNGCAVALVLLLPLVRSSAQLWLLYVVASGYGIAAVFLRPAQAGLLKTLIRHEDLAAANAYLRSAGDAVRVISPMLGVGIYALIGGPALAVAVAALFLIAAAAFWLIRAGEAAATPQDPAESVARRIGAGLRHVWSQPHLVLMTVAIGLAFGVVGFFDSSDFAVVGEGLRRPASFLGVLAGIQGVGSVAGGMTAAVMIRKLGEMRTAGAGLLAMSLGALGMMHTALGVVIGAFAIFGVGVPWLIVGYSTAWQRGTPGELVGRVAAAADLSILGPQAVSIPIGATLIELVPYRVLLTVCCAALFLAGTVLVSHRLASTKATAAPSRPAGSSIR